MTKKKNIFGAPVFGNSNDNPANSIMRMAMQGLDIDQLASIISDMTEEDGMMAFSMIGELVNIGITPEKYATLYQIFQNLKPIADKDIVKTLSDPAKKQTPGISYNPDATTLLIRIQMKGVTKPPMWREIEVPAGITFLQLHDIIQIVTGLEDCHLWQFNKKAYDGDIQIGIPMKHMYDRGIDYVTDDASCTPITTYLAQEGDKLEYVYDFGDDWIFTISVKKIIDKKSEYPVCTAFKSPINPQEDSGGIWSYEKMRSDYAFWPIMTKKKRKKAADEMCYQSAEDYHDALVECLFDLDFVNESLKPVTD